MNLIITCPRHFEKETEDEIRDFLNEFGDQEPEITPTNMSGILTVKTTLKEREIVQKIRELIIDEPWTIRYCRRIIPINVTTDTDADNISKEILKLVQDSKMTGSYRISIEKRNSELSTQNLISKIAPKIKNKVSLEKPDWIVLIEILGDTTGISILKNNEILSVEKTKRSLSE